MAAGTSVLKWLHRERSVRRGALGSTEGLRVRGFGAPEDPQSVALVSGCRV